MSKVDVNRNRPKTGEPKKHTRVWVANKGFWNDGMIDTRDFHDTKKEALECEKRK